MTKTNFENTRGTEMGQSSPQINCTQDLGASMMGSLMMHDYVGEKNFWINELIGNDKIKMPEYVQRVITMGQFLESRALEKIPNNPTLGRCISKELCQFVSECVADQGALSKIHTKLMQNIGPTMKAHTLLYIMHQLFKHENRFGQIYDLTDESNLIRTGSDNAGYVNVTQNIRVRAQKGLDIIKEEVDVGISPDDGDLVDDFQTKDSGLNDRLDLFIGDVDLYTSMLIQLEKEGGDEEMPAELAKVLFPVKEKT